MRRWLINVCLLYTSLAAICAALDCQPGDILEYVDGISGDADDANSK